LSGRPRRIGILAPGFSASEEDWCIPALLDLVRVLAREDDVRVFTLRYPHSRQPYAVHGARVFPFGAGQRRGLHRLPLYFRALSAIVEEARSRPFDVLHGLWADEPGFLAVAAGRKTRTPAVVSILGGELVNIPDIGYGGQRSLVDRRLSSAAIRTADRVTVGSSWARERELSRRPALRWRVMPLGVDTTRFAPGPVAPSARRLPGRPKLLHVASLTPVKDQATLLRAFALVSRRLPDARLSIAGEGPLRAGLEGRAAALGIADRVVFLGAVPHGDLPDLYRQADLFVLSSRFESQAMVVLEAAASGCPIVGTTVGILPQLQEGSQAVAPADPEGLAAAVSRVLEDDAERRRAADAVLRTVRAELDVHVVVARLRALYDEISGAGSPPPAG